MLWSRRPTPSGDSSWPTWNVPSPASATLAIRPYSHGSWMELNVEPIGSVLAFGAGGVGSPAMIAPTSRSSCPAGM